MKNLHSSLKIFILVLISASLSSAQNLSPDQMINKLKKDDKAFAFTIPGWFIKLGGKIAVNDLESGEKELVKELTSHIKKLRFVVCQELPTNFEDHLTGLKNYMNSKSYEPLISVKDPDSGKINLWAKFDGNTINNLVISILNNEDESAFFNIKSDLDFDTLKKMEFFKEWSSL